MSKKPNGKTNPLAAAERADRNRKILIQAGVAAMLIGLIAAIGIGIAVKNADKNDLGPTPSIAATASGLPNGATATVTDNGAVRIGKPDAKVTVRVVADLQCPACKAFEAANAQAIKNAVDNGTAIVEYNIISFLNEASTTKYSSRAANAAYCVAEADPSKYVGWLVTMYEQQPGEGSAGLTDDQLIDIAKSAGVPDSVGQCIKDNNYNEYIGAKTEDVQNSGVQTTPTIFVNGTQVKNQDIGLPNGQFKSDAMAAVIAAAAAK
ncbi:thioredoxin domain-containing protein [Nocardia sp. R6R-6]|uniref:thioredoxin domain-containing protein n=1 Tax=Nocardia sp. R6R-6 TaxID=3459303 RepID=UPI00403DBF9F